MIIEFWSTRSWLISILIRIQIYFDLSACMTRFCIFILIKKYCPHDTMTHFKMGNNFISTVLHNALTLKRRSHGCKMEWLSAQLRSDVKQSLFSQSLASAKYTHVRLSKQAQRATVFFVPVKNWCCLYHYSSQGFGFSSSKGCPVCSTGMGERHKGVLDLPKLIRAKSVDNMCLF